MEVLHIIKKHPSWKLVLSNTRSAFAEATYNKENEFNLLVQSINRLIIKITHVNSEGKLSNVSEPMGHFKSCKYVAVLGEQNCLV